MANSRVKGAFLSGMANKKKHLSSAFRRMRYDLIDVYLRSQVVDIKMFPLP